MNMTFVKCTDEIMYCLSDHDLQALKVIYATRIKAAVKHMEAGHVPHQRDSLVTTTRLIYQIYETIMYEQARRNPRQEKED
jgi:hypothetical protein